jgi:hypothetical protein
VRVRRWKSTDQDTQDLSSAADTDGMTKSIAASALCLLPLLAACPPDSSPCVRLGNDVLIEVTKDSEPDNVGDCRVPAAFRLSALGCNVAVSASPDLCDIKYDLICLGNARITLQVKQLQDDGIVGELHKVDLDSDNVEECVLDLDVLVKNTPAPSRPAE